MRDYCSAPICDISVEKADKGGQTEDIWCPVLFFGGAISSISVVVVAMATAELPGCGWYFLGSIGFAGCLITALLWLVTPMGYFEVGRLRKQHNRAVAKLELLVHLRNECSRDLDVEQINILEGRLEDTAKHVLGAYRLMGSFKDKRKIARKGGISTKPWNMDGLIEVGKFTEIKSELMHIEAKMAIMASQSGVEL
jgi:hypothetical protein